MISIQCENDWWKWGDASKRRSLTDYPKLKAHIEHRWGKGFDEKFPGPDEFNVTADEEKAKMVSSLFQAALPEIKFSIDARVRLKRTLGKSYPDLLAALTKTPILIPDAVAYPRTHEDILKILDLASKNKILIIPYGGGSNVVRSFAIPDKNLKPRLVIDMAEMKDLMSIDEVNHTAVFQCGIYGPALEKTLNQKGFTLGHFPQSFEFSTLGGWIATRSAGQESSAYGRIEDIVISIKAATPAGTITTSIYEGDAEGINIKSLFYGSEGMFGVVTEAKVRIHLLPKNKKWMVSVFPSYQSGLNALRLLVQKDIFPSVVRFSDEHETFFLSLLSHETSPLSKLKSSLSRLVLKWKKMHEPSIMMIRLDGEEDEAEVKKEIARSVFGRCNGFDVGESLGKKWEASRFSLPYLRDDLMEREIFIDTMETVVPWNKLDDLRRKLNEKLKTSEAFHNEKGILLAHVSHVYTSAASIYFTVLTPKNRDNSYAQWKDIKTLVTETILTEGGAVSHHHSIGTDHQKWYLQKTDVLTLEVLRSIKRALDPNHILNPGKLFDGQAGAN